MSVSAGVVVNLLAPAPAALFDVFTLRRGAVDVDVVEVVVEVDADVVSPSDWDDSP